MNIIYELLKDLFVFKGGLGIFLMFESGGILILMLVG